MSVGVFWTSRVDCFSFAMCQIAVSVERRAFLILSHSRTAAQQMLELHLNITCTSVLHVVDTFLSQRELIRYFTHGQAMEHPTRADRMHRA